MKFLSSQQLIFFTLSFCLGIYTHTTSYDIYILGAVAFLFVASLITHNQKTISILIALGFLSGYACTLRKHHQFFQHQNLINKLCTVEGVVTQINSNKPNSQQIAINTRAVYTYKKRYNVHKKIIVFTPDNIPIEPGATIKLKNIKLSQSTSPSFRLYMLKEDIWATAHQNKLNFSIIASANTLQKKLNQVSYKLTHVIARKLTKQAACLYEYIVLGIKRKNLIAQSFKSQFQFWGTSHQLARSGLHVVMLIGTLMLLLGFIPISYTTKLITTGSLLLLYALLTPHSIAFLRAIYMYFAYLICKITKTPTRALHIITITALFTLIQNPFQLFALDFQLSFVATTIIILYFQQRQVLENIAS